MRWDIRVGEAEQVVADLGWEVDLVVVLVGAHWGGSWLLAAYFSRA